MNKKSLFIVLLLVLLGQGAVLRVFAVRAYPYPITVTQPDGTSLTILLQGDEFQHYQTTEDGYLLKANARGFLTYATVNVAGETVGSAFSAHNIPGRTAREIQFLKSIDQPAVIRLLQRAPLKSKAFQAPGVVQRVFQTIGSPKSLVILANFQDVSFVTPNPQTAFTNLLNQAGYSTNGGTGSARDYFMASSYGKFAPNFDVVGPVTLPHAMAYYGTNVGGPDGNDSLPVQMVIDACVEANRAGLDFTPYDTDNDGIIDNVFIYYAGYNEAEGGPSYSIWPHRWGVYPQELFPSGYNYTGTLESVTFNGKRLLDYACTSELRGNSGSTMCGIGTFSHEFGHVLGLPDYYDTSGKQGHTLDSWDIMSSGNYNNQGRTPPTYSVYDRFFLGYLVPEPESSTANLTLNPIYQGTTPPASTANQAFLLSATTHNLNGSNPSPAEFFLLEYRKKTGWDTYLPAEGMCIWHIDYKQSAWDNNNPNNYTGTTQTLASHMRVYLVPPTGVGTTPPKSAFTSGSFTPTLWAGTDINRAFSNITTTANAITFNFMPPKVNTNGTFTGFSTTLGTVSASQSITVLAGNLTGNLNLSLQHGIHFDVKLSTDASWSKSLSVAPIAGNVNATVFVRYNPTMTGTQTDSLIISNTGLATTGFNLYGSATLGPNSPVIYVGKIDNTLQFQVTKLNVPNTKHINIQTTDLTGDLSLAVTGPNAALFSVLPGTVTKDAANGAGGFSIIITYTPTETGSHTATLTISGGGLTPAKVVNLTGTGI
ncbi:MAG: M6 family metalloprotease domain-containing protein [Bacteroidota bacterium]|nr:M6 family metalloprotease domain-containing protein [Bacteroidota bacterium]